MKQAQRVMVSSAAVVAMGVLAGCNPTDKISDSPVVQATATEVATGNTTVAAQGTEPQADNEPVVIRGDLQSVDWPSMLGRKIVVEGDLVVVDTYDLIRRGQVKVARDRLYVPTTRVDPNDADPDATSFEGGSNVAKVVAAQKANDNATIILDDGSAEQNVFPPALFPELGKTLPSVRIGSVVHGAKGRLVKAGNVLLFVLEEPLKWTPAERPQRPQVGDADVTIASFNVLNFFTTIDDGSNNARGADSQSELKRQEAKIVSAITKMQADVIGLMEMENSIDAEKRLVDALNQKAGKDVYKGSGIPDGFDKTPGGSDAIRVGIIYRADRVSPVEDVRIVNDRAFARARTPVVQSFKSNQGGKPFTVIVNHFKSKGGASNADEANKNKGDGQAAYNAVRRDQALAISKYIQSIKQGDSQPRVLVIGDLNAYQQEDPIDALRASGMVDLHERFGKQSAKDGDTVHYSFNYYGQSGSLDHAFATESMASDVTGIATWHINADEPRFLDYNEEFNPKELYSDDSYRSSDHDPVLIGIRK